jgi:carbonic anhydrase
MKQLATLAAAALLAISFKASALPPGVPLAKPQQTPIDITRSNTVTDTNKQQLTFSYGVDTVTLSNTFGSTANNENGDAKVIAREWATLKATPSGTNFITVGGIRYNLLQFHFHTPSEHAVGGVREPMEIHFVHVRSDLAPPDCGGVDRPLVVVGGFIAESPAANAELSKLFTAGTLPADKNQPTLQVTLDLSKILPVGQPTWRYEGGLTAPASACSSFEPLSTQLVTGEFPEAVHWFLYSKKLYLNKPAIDKFRALFPEGNARALKDAGDRKVYDRTK